MEERRVADSVKVLFVTMMTMMMIVIAVMMITIMMVDEDEDFGCDNIWRLGELMVDVVAAVVRDFYSRIEIFQTKPFHVSGEQEGEDWLGHLFPKVNPPALDLLREEKVRNDIKMSPREAPAGGRGGRGVAAT